VDGSSGPNAEVWLVDLEGDAESHSGSEQHLGALHEVEHHVFKPGQEGFIVDDVEVNELVRGDLDPDVSSDERQLSSHFLELMVLYPWVAWLMLVLLEEENRIR